MGRQRLMGLLWPEQSEEAARHSLSESLYLLRRELGGVLAARGSDVVLDPAGVAVVSGGGGGGEVMVKTRRTSEKQNKKKQSRANRM